MPNPPKSGTDWLRQQRSAADAATSPAEPTCNGIDALDSRVERFLQLHSVKYAKKTMIPIEMIDEKSSLDNQAREVPIVPDAVERYATSLRRGDYLPPLIVRPVGNKVSIVDGNNRHGAHKRVGNRFIPGFVIAADTPSEVIRLLTVAANRENAEAVPVRWRKVQAVDLLGLGYSQEQACEAAGITKSQLGDFLALDRADARAKQFHVAGFQSLSETARIALGRIPGDPVFDQLARAAVEFEIDADTAKRVLRDVKALGSEGEQVTYAVAFVNEQRAKRVAEGGKGGKARPSVSSPKNAFVSAAGKILNVSTLDLVRQTLTEHDRDGLVRWAELVGEKMVEVQIALEAIKFTNDDSEVKRAS